MSQVTKSARAIPRCRGCGEPTKGHAGPTGIARCQNQAPGDVNQNSNMNHGATAVKAVKVLPIGSTKLKLVSDSLVGKPSATNEDKLDRHVGFEVGVSQQNDDSLIFADPELHENIERCIATLSLEDDASEESKATQEEEVIEEAEEHESEESKAIQEEEVIEEAEEHESEESKAIEEEHESVDVNTRSLSKRDNEDFLSQSTLEDLDSLLKIDEKTLIQKRLAPERVTSSSDNDMDIRKVLAGNSFQLCECVRSDGACGCKGLLNLDNGMEGDLENVFMDPLSEGETDFAPTVRSKKSSWKKKSPNEMMLYLDSVTACGVSSSKGEIKMKALRFVEMIKGKKVLSVEVEAEIEMSIRVDKLYTKRGYSSPMTFSRKFKLIEVKSLGDDSNVEKSIEEDIPAEDMEEENVVFEKADESAEGVQEDVVFEKADVKSAPAIEPYVSYDESAVSKNGQLAYIPNNDNESVPENGITDVCNEEDEGDCENGQKDESECGTEDDIADEDLNEQDSDTEDEVDEDDISDGDSDAASEKKTTDSSDDEEDDGDIGQTEESLTRGNASSDENGCEEESWIEESLDETNDDLNDMNSESVDKD